MCEEYLIENLKKHIYINVYVKNEKVFPLKTKLRITFFYVNRKVIKRNICLKSFIIKILRNF